MSGTYINKPSGAGMIPDLPVLANPDGMLAALVAGRTGTLIDIIDYKEVTASGTGRELLPTEFGDAFGYSITEYAERGFAHTRTSTSGSYVFQAIGVWPATNISGSPYFFDTESGRMVVGHNTTDELEIYDGSWKSFGYIPYGKGAQNIVINMDGDGGNAYLWVNGSFEGSVSYTARNIGGTSRIWARYANNRSVDNSPTGVYISAFNIWGHAKEDAQSRSVLENAFVYLKPRRNYWIMTSGATSINLVIDSALHSQTAGNIGLVQQNTLSIQDSLNNQASDNIDLSQSASIEVQGVGQSQSSDNLDLIQQNTLAMEGGDHSQAADNIDLVQSNVLDTQDALQSQSSDNIVLNLADVLIVSNPLHSVAADNIDLVQANILVVQGVESAQDADNIDLVQQSTLSVGSSTHSQSADNIDLSQSIMLIVQEAEQAASVDNLDLVQSNILAVAGSLQSISSDNIELIQSSTLVVSDALHALISDNIALIDDEAVIITPTGRLFVVNSEERVFIVAAETRTFIVN